jgi:predicted AlkP superfamily phosphohydrolase/phosphomutase
MDEGYTRRDFLEHILGMGTGLFLTGSSISFFGCEQKKAQEILNHKRGLKYKRVIILGMDGLDPKIVMHLMKQGEMPNFLRLGQTGNFSPLATSTPPQSPTAWASIATGNNPGYHGMFDFINRRVENYMPDLAILKKNPDNLLGRRESMFLPVMQGETFWDHTSSEGIPSTIVRWPATFPPKKGRAKVFYTTKHISGDAEGSDKVIRVKINSGIIKTFIKGPSVTRLIETKESKAELNIRILSGGSRAEVVVGDKKVTLNKGVWSEWLEVKFDVGFTKKITGIVRFYLNRVKPEFELFMTSVEINPRDPSFVISNPDSYVQELSEQLGYFHTLGIPEDTKALSDGRIDEDAFISMCDRIVDEQERMLTFELNKFKDGLLAFVFFSTDRIQHIFWVTRDPEHPLYDSAYARKYGHVIEDYYRKMDRILGGVMKHVDDKTALMVCSDHGFTSFRRSVHLNSWLVENGFMSLTREFDKNDPEGGSLFRYVDWDNTRAYALGFSSIYMNMENREGKGIVREGIDLESVLNDIKAGLSGLADPKDGRKVVRKVYQGSEIYSGDRINFSPDLIVGFNEGFRMSWQTAIGGSPVRVLDDNLNKWTGDHIVDPSIVPGVFLSNFKINTDSPGLFDIAPTVLSCFGLSVSDVEGNTLL